MQNPEYHVNIKHLKNILMEFVLSYKGKMLIELWKFGFWFPEIWTENLLPASKQAKQRKRGWASEQAFLYKTTQNSTFVNST